MAQPRISAISLRAPTGSAKASRRPRSGSARFDAKVAGEDFAAGNEADLDAEVLA